MKRRVVVTGLGVLAPNGIGRNQFGEAIFAGKSGIAQITSLDTSNLKVKIAGEVTNFDPCDYIPIHIYRKSDRFVHLGLSATKLAMDDANILADSPFLKKAFVVIGGRDLRSARTKRGGLGPNQKRYHAPAHANPPQKSVLALLRQ